MQERFRGGDSHSLRNNGSTGKPRPGSDGKAKFLIVHISSLLTLLAPGRTSHLPPSSPVSKDLTTTQPPAKRKKHEIIDLTGDDHEESSLYNNQLSENPPRQRRKVATTKVPDTQSASVSHSRDSRAQETNAVERGDHRQRGRIIDTTVNTTVSEIITLREKRVFPVVEASMGPIQQNFSNPTFVKKIKKAAQQGRFAIPPELLCIPISGPKFMANGLETLLAKRPERRTITYQSNHYVSFFKVLANYSVSEGDINPKLEASHQCGLDVCIIPKHVNPSTHADDEGCNGCHELARMLLEVDQDIPLFCTEHDIPCRMASSVIPWEAHVVAGWMYSRGWSSLEDVPLDFLPELHTEGTFMNMELRPYELVTSDGRQMIRPGRGRTLRDHILAKLNTTVTQELPALDDNPQPSTPPRGSTPDFSYRIDDEQDADFVPSGETGEESSSSSPSRMRSDLHLAAVKDELDDILSDPFDAGSDADDSEINLCVPENKERQCANAMAIILPSDIVTDLKTWSTRKVHSNTYTLNRQRMSDKVRKVEEAGQRLWLSSRYPDTLYTSSNSRGCAMPGTPCMLCNSEIYTVLSKSQRFPAYPALHLHIGTLPVKILRHIQGHHQHDTVKAMTLEDMLSRTPWLSALPIKCYNTKSILLMIDFYLDDEFINTAERNGMPDLASDLRNMLREGRFPSTGFINRFLKKKIHRRPKASLAHSHIH